MDTRSGTGPLVVGNNRLNPLVVVVGETGSGKSALALDLAERFHGEIICADSRTVYKGMDIGTAKPTPEERARIPHYGLDVVTPDETFSAADFQTLAYRTIRDIATRGKVPIMVGGTGLYIASVLYDYGFAGPDAPRDPQNPRHVLRGETGNKGALRPNTLILGLTQEREVLRKRLTNRVEHMVADGFIEELKGLVERYGWDAPALQATGYKAFRKYLAGELTLDEAKQAFVTNDMQLAKRQRTWFKRNNSIQWLNNSGEAVDIVTTFLDT